MRTREVVLITGMTGSGKSVLFRKMIQSYKRIIIFDAVKEYEGLIPPFPAGFIFDFKSLVEFLRKNQNKPFRVIFSPANPFGVEILSNGETISCVELLCRIVYNGLTDIVLGIEELGKFPTQKEISPWLYNIICLGRHKQISLYATTQRAAQISTDFKAQITRFIAFKQHLQNDIDWIGDCIGDKKAAEAIRELGKYQHKEYVL